MRATGIRYATADRFAAPRTAPDHTEPLDASHWSPASPQTHDVLGDDLFSPALRDLGTDEHPQRLSILAPADVADDEALPVIVWIHGGSNIFGAGDSSITDPADLVREQRLVVVTVTYRLGALGYIGTDDRPANLGLLDQAEALRWVRRNIGAFGGNPRNVTAMGESAGGDAIAHLLAAFSDEPLCDRAIVQSPPLGIRRGRGRMTAAVAKAVAGLDAESTIEELLAVEKPVIAAARRFGMTGSMPFGVQYGQDPLPDEDDVEAAWAAVAPRVPLLIGTMGTEMTLFSRPSPLVERLGRSAVIDRRILEPAERWSTDVVFTRGIDEMARVWADAGDRALRYEIPWAPPGNPFRSPHGLDVILQFGSRDVWRRARVARGSTWQDFSRAGRALRAVWGAFARGKDPGAGTPGVITIREV